MAIVRCPVGHFYDNQKFTSCPVCAESGYAPSGNYEGKTVNLEDIAGPEEVTQNLTPEDPESVKGNWDDELTVSLGEMETGEAPLLVGWLVCTKGESRGQDYRLYPGFNRIGRRLDSDICIQDPQVARDNHCSVVYDRDSNKFYLVPGQGSNTYLNGEVLQKPAELNENVPFSIGSHTLELTAFCRKEYRWQK